MAQILKFPVQASKFGYKRVRKRETHQGNQDQLDLFPAPTAEILSLESGLGLFEQALLLDERGDSRAAELYEQAIHEHDSVADAYCNLGILESQKGNTAKAVDHFTASLQFDPRHSEAHYNLGNLYFEVNDLRLAQVHYEIAAKLEPSFPNVYFNLGLVHASNNDLADAITALSKYQELVSEEDARIADDLLQNLKKSLTASKNSRFGATS